MDDGGQPSNSFGNGQPSRTPQHTRPFFYVQPASQPYVPMYQHWHLNNPYNPYGMPGGYNVGRPYGQPYPYMQYPGYVLPQQMMHPLDYRRMFEPRFHPPPWADMPRPPQQPQQYQYPPPPPSPLRREMACSEVQTDPSDAINKLIECLGKMRGVELGVAERELDSGVGSQTSGIFSPGEEKKSDEEGVSRAAVSTSSSSSSSSGAQPSPGVTFSDSTTAVYDAESSHRSLEDLGTPGAWSVGFEEPPLDSSSVREETPSGAPEPAEKRDLFAFCLPGPLPDRVTVAPRGEERPTEVVDRRSDGVAPVVLVTTTSVDLGSDPEEPLPETVAVLHQAQEVWCPTAVPVEAEADLSYRILRLPFDPSAPFAGDLLRSSPSSRGTEPARLAPGCLPSPVSPLYYGYLPRQRTQERLSVLSPSLDELSSRDEMFSTDLDDMDLFPRRVYASRRPVASGHRTTEEAWPAGAKRYSCACCGKGLAKAGGPAASRSKGSDVRSYRDETGDSDDECRYARSQPDRAAARKPVAGRKAESVSLRHASSKHPHKRIQCKEGSSVADGEEGRDRRVEDGGETGDLTSGDLQYITCQDKLCREDLTTGRWEEEQPRRRQQGQLHKQDMHRKAPSKMMPCHRTREEESKNEEPPSRYRWERGTGKGEPR
ncbi:uncharacterized protein LOC115536944 [Gadus morhua]|uniref:uncharacterized protein LOC115536944 n=1 Tax=Gadus morhua TaxID=8049 RepID=UPI0011B5494D|nr:uncharacterized protein LOC115536944 [Gadus morhua]